MKFEWYLALRYFKGNRKGNRFLSFIKIMSITGVAVGSAGLLIALSIVHGFKSTINDKILGFAPHITVTTFTDLPLQRADTVMTFLDQYPEISAKQKIIQGQIMLQSKDNVTGAIIKGVDETGDILNLGTYVETGEYKLSRTSSGLPGLVLGTNLARALEVEIGSVITVFTVKGIPSLLNSPEIQQFELTGIYRTGIDQFDDVFAIVAREYPRALFGLNSAEAHGIELKLHDSSQILVFDAQLNEVLPFPYYKESIYAKFGNIFEWVELQENLIPLVISVMIIVAAFNLIGAVLMMVLERTRDIGILKTMGSKSSVIRRIFLLEGLIVSVVGLGIGMGISLLFAFLQLKYQIIKLSEENYYMSYAPVEPHLIDFVIVAAVTISLCALASYIPARVAAKTDPLKVIAFGR